MTKLDYSHHNLRVDFLQLKKPQRSSTGTAGHLRKSRSMLLSQKRIDYPCRDRPSAANSRPFLYHGTALSTVAWLRLEGNDPGLITSTSRYVIDQGLPYLTAFLVFCAILPTFLEIVSKEALITCLHSALSNLVAITLSLLSPPNQLGHFRKSSLIPETSLTCE